jgi:molybdopterin synthase catalytic subunit
MRQLEHAVAHAGAGAVCSFAGVVRDHNLGRTIQYLEYEAYEEMALAAMERIAERAVESWPEVRIAIAHRLGRLEIGETSVAIAASHPHRAEAFAACRFAIDTLKAEVPIWKKEVWADGSHWVEGYAPSPLTP